MADKDKWIEQAVSMGYSDEETAIAYAECHDSLTDEDFVNLYREKETGKAPKGGLASDGQNMASPGHAKNSPKVNRDFVRGIYNAMERSEIYRPPQPYIRDENLRLVQNPDYLRKL